jgi:vacuolar protein sorting-associated protein 16
MYEKCGMRVKAAEEAVKLKDVPAFEKLLDAAGGRDTPEGREIDQVGQTLKGR